MQLKTVLVPCDFSDFAALTLPLGAGTGRKPQGPYCLLRAVPGFSAFVYPESVYLPDLAKMEAEERTAAEGRLREFAAKKGTSTAAVETRVVLGDPFWEICQAAESEHADLVVMGSHGRTGLAHLLPGSVAERLSGMPPVQC